MREILNYKKFVATEFKKSFLANSTKYLRTPFYGTPSLAASEGNQNIVQSKYFCLPLPRCTVYS